MKYTYQRTQHWMSHCCTASIKQLFVFALALLSASLLTAQAANDDCANATALTVGACPANAVAGNTSDGTPDGDFSCDSAGDNAGLWYSFVAPATGAVTLNVTDLGAGTPESAVFDACGGTELSCSTSAGSRIVSSLTPGATYLVVVWGDVSFGQGPFEICVEEATPISNDDCSGATPLTVGACPANAVSGNTVNATPDGDFGCDSAGDNAGLWYSFVAPATGGINIQVEDTGGGNPEAAIFDACGGTEIWCDGSPDNEVVSGLTPGNTYYVIVWGDVTAGQGPFNICVDEFVPLANDDCSSAIMLGIGDSDSGNTALATDNNPPSCGGAGDGSSGGVWYTVTGTGLDITASLCSGTDFDTQLAVYEGSCSALSCLDGNDQFCGNQSEVTWNSIAGTTYYIYIDGWLSNSGNYTITIDGMLPPPIPNDNCDVATLITCGETISGSTIGAFPDNVRRCSPGDAAGGVWYVFNPDDGGWIQSLSTCDAANFDTKITVYYGDCGRLRCLGAVDNSEACGGGTTEMFFTPFFGRTHYVLVQTVDPTVPGIFELTYNCNASPFRPQGATVFTPEAAENLEDITLFPNPVQDELNVQLEGFTGRENTTISIRNSFGQLVMERRVARAGAQTERFNTSQLPAGMYFLSVQAEGKETLTKRFVVGAARP